jgi:hypothetical protein
MSNLLTSLAFIKTSIDEGNSIWDSLVRLMLNSINENDIKEVSAEQFCGAFKKSYNMSIPLHPMNMIIGKIKNMGFIDASSTKWIIERKIIRDIVIETENAKKVESVISDLKGYFREIYHLEKSIEEIEEIFVGFLNVYDNDILYCLETKSILPEIEITNDDKYVVSTYIQMLVNQESPIVTVLEDILLANIHLNSIFFVESSRKLKLNRTYVYLDTRLILRLTGIEGEFRKEEYENLISILYENKCNLRMFDIHYNEVTTILDDCIKSLESPRRYVPKYASKALRYFVEHNCSVSDVLLCKASLDELQKKYKISIDDHNYDAEALNQYMINETELAAIINQFYSENGNHFESQNVDEMIWNDVKAISSIYRKRKGFRTNQLENVNAILVTNNRTLSRAVRQYNKVHATEQKYSECVTDTYWGTSIWLNTAYKETSFFRKKLIADCISITQMNPKLKEKYLKNVEELNKKGTISESQYYILKEYSRASEYVKNATFNDDEQYSDSLPEEVIEHFKDEIAKPFEQIIADKGADISDKEQQLLVHSERHDKQKKVIEDDAKRTSIIAMVIFGICANIPSGVLIFVDFIPNICIKLVFRIISLVIGILLGIDGFGRKVFGNKIYRRRKEKLEKKWNI